MSEVDSRSRGYSEVRGRKSALRTDRAVALGHFMRTRLVSLPLISSSLARKSVSQTVSRQVELPTAWKTCMFAMGARKSRQGRIPSSARTAGHVGRATSKASANSLNSGSLRRSGEISASKKSTVTSGSSTLTILDAKCMASLGKPMEAWKAGSMEHFDAAMENARAV